jgi:SOS response regulatory protein OraA/RecX
MQAYKRAIRLLSVKAYFRKDLEDRLRQEGFADVEIKQALEKCASYLDDEAILRSKIRAKAKKGYGPHHILASLRNYNPTQAAISEIDERETLLNYLRKHPKLQCDPKAKRRLAARGFSYELIEEVLKISPDDL